MRIENETNIYALYNKVRLGLIRSLIVAVAVLAVALVVCLR